MKIHKSVLIVGVIVIVTSLVCMLVYISKSNERFTQHRTLPKHIWTFWHDNELPDVITRCITTWKKLNPDYNVTVLTVEKVRELCGFDLTSLNVDKNFRARLSDFARLLILFEYGGIWVDASTIMTQPLTWVENIYKQENAELIAYYAPVTTNNAYPVIENWFLAAPRHSKFIKDWLNEALYMTTFETENMYVQHVKDNTDTDIQNLDSQLPYLIMHLCAAVVQQKKGASYNLHLMNGLDGPLKYLADNGWKLPEAINALCAKEELQTPLVKLRGTERKYIEQTDHEGLKCTTTNKYIAHVIRNT